MRRLSWVLILTLASCQSAPAKREQLMELRVRQFKSLPRFAPMRCLVMAQLTEPAHARYAALFPGQDFDRRALTYDYRATASTCSVTPVEPGAVSRNYQSFLETAFCVLLQAHWVNSPFDGLDYRPEDLENKGDLIHVRPSTNGGGSGELGLYLSPDELNIETRTRARGVFKASYTLAGKKIVIPTRIEQRQAHSIFLTDHFRFDPSRDGARPLLRAFDISVGEKEPALQAHVDVSDCRLDL